MRWIVGFAAVVFLGWSQFMGLPWDGPELFAKLSWLVFGAALSAGVFTTADCLSSERRNGTLGLLFLTNLRPHQIILGKLAATSLTPIYGLVAVTPLLAVPVLMGGVTLGDVLFVALALGLILFVSLSVAMLVSAISTSEFEAILGTFMSLAGVCIAPKFFAFLATLMPGIAVTSNVSLDEFLMAISPFYIMMIALNGPSAPYAWAITMLFLTVTAFGASCLWSAGWIVRRSVRDGFGDLTEPLFRFRRFVTNLFRPRNAPRALPARRSVSEKFAAYRHRMLDTNPVLWLVNREPLRVHYVWSIAAAFTFVWLVGFVTAPSVWMDLEITVFLTFLLNGVLKILLAIEAPRQLAEDRKSGSLELILSTPLTEKELISGYARAVQLQFMKPIFVVIVAEWVLVWAGFAFQARPDIDVAAVICASGILLVTDALTLTVAGVSVGLRSKIPARAAMRGIFWVLVFPWLIVAVLGAGWELHSSFQRYYFLYYYNDDHNRGLWLLCFATMLTYSLYLGRWEKRRLNSSFRKLAAESPSTA